LKSSIVLGSYKKSAMQKSALNRMNLTTPARSGEQGNVRTVLVAVVSFVLGLGAGAMWLYHPAGQTATTANVEATNQPVVAAADESAAVVSPNARAEVAALKPPPATTATIDEVKHLIPNLDSVTLEEGTQILRKAALTEFTAAANDMDAKVQAAEQSLLNAQNGGSAAVQQAAMKQLQQAEAGQTERLQAIAAKSRAQIEALQQIKAATGH
jgi:hypothetical protein